MSTIEVAEAPDMAKRPFLGPGWYKGMTDEEYHKSFGWSSSQVKTLVEKTPKHLIHGLTVQDDDSTATMNLGTALHTLILEPHRFAEKIKVRPIWDNRSKAGKAERIEFEAAFAGMTLITEAQFDKASAMAESVLMDPIARLLVTDCITESSIYWWYKSMDADDDVKYKTMVKVRPDILSRNNPVVVDIKTTDDASYSGFIRSVLRYKYDLSAAMYLEGVNQCRPLLDELGHFAYTNFIFICIENTAPYCVAVYELSPEWLELGKMKYRNSMRILNSAKVNDWPGYESGPRILEPPPWAMKAHVV